MLTLKQAYKSVYEPLSLLSLPPSPRPTPMTTPHRGLPPPAAMGLQQPAPVPSAPAPAPSHHHGWSALPPPPQQWQGAEDAMRNWLRARAEEEKTRQEEERTRQESLRLEQRRVEMDMLRASLNGGIPPPMIPLVFIGAGGTLPQTALEWAQHFMQPSQSLRPPHSPVRDPPSSYQTAASNPTPYAPYPASPSRPRGQTVAGIVGRQQQQQQAQQQSAPQPQPPPPTPSLAPPYQPHVQESSPSIYFHHWQPPTSHPASGSAPNPTGGGTSSTSTAPPTAAAATAAAAAAAAAAAMATAPPSSSGGAGGSTSSNRPGSPSTSSKTKRKRDSL
ncbi:hypothetical protein CDD80_6828 [Ophiocordyceps camponoti-rufipedis]|uniref:Uncharacterized protein n=1 Tax=Ophiocordyceps camponoti-rufipedis TaxID=2004952 RepID=A0A2C5YKN3_9HYPO|nr:hypothetical protein CDD80_6828 [Ophiocordyceps camponoti-rufipedis]